MSKIKNNHPCKCGHYRINHRIGGSLSHILLYGRQLWCQVTNCICNDFKADNLKYLEKKYDKK